MKKSLIRLIIGVIYFMVVSISNIIYAQPNPGGNPDGTPPAVVPFDRNLSVIIISAGIILAIVIFRKIKAKQLVRE